MKYGLCLPYMKAGLSREDYLAWFRRVDEGPFHSVSCGERVHGPTYDMRVVLAAAATATERVEITPTLYVLPMHSAVRVAKEIATLDILSGGRVGYVVGLGYREAEFAMFGVDPAQRAQVMDDKLGALLQALRGDPFNYQGRSVHLTPAPAQPLRRTCDL